MLVPGEVASISSVSLHGKVLKVQPRELVVTESEDIARLDRLKQIAIPSSIAKANPHDQNQDC